MLQQLTHQELQVALAALEGWSLLAGKLHKEYRFADFAEAFGFMTRVASLAEEQDHHPEWCNVYSSLRVDLTTHAAGGITERDIRLAKSMDALLHRDVP